MKSIGSIIKRSARILKLKIDDESIDLIACRARGTPRVANRLLKRIRDYAQVKANGVVTQEVTMEAMGKLEVDQLGLDEIDRKVMRTIIQKFDGGPVGLDTIAASISEESDTIEGVYEPYLLQLGFPGEDAQGPHGNPPGIRASRHRLQEGTPYASGLPLVNGKSEPAVI